MFGVGEVILSETEITHQHFFLVSIKSILMLWIKVFYKYTYMEYNISIFVSGGDSYE